MDRAHIEQGWRSGYTAGNKKSINGNWTNGGNGDYN